MKRTLRTIAAIALGSAFAIPNFAGAVDHGSMGGMKKDETKSSALAVRHGKQIRAARVAGYKVEYYLLELAETMKNPTMKDMDTGKMKSHHLMAYVTSPEGKAVQDVQVGYLLRGPLQGEQKSMAMFMDGGYGADVDLKGTGACHITTKVLVGDKTLVDKFTYTVK
jgi:hypothetical protein